MVIIVNRYPERVTGNMDLRPEAPDAVSLLASELVWVLIEDEDGQMLKDMVMQPDHLFRIPPGGQFYATLGNAGGVRVRVGNHFLPTLGRSGEEIGGVDLSPNALLQWVKK